MIVMNGVTSDVCVDPQVTSDCLTTVSMRPQ
jgi:hypothetical protein